jgi:hypothetical protein
MTHDEAVAALDSLPEVERIEVVRLKPTDVIVFESSRLLSEEAIARMRASVQPIWPDNKIVVCENGLRLKVVSGA